MGLQYHQPETLEDVLALRARLGGGARYLAGGTELNRGAGAGAAEALISLQRLGLDRIEALAGGVRIGACCTVQRVVDAAELPLALRVAARQLASRTIRNMATLGGQIAGSRRCADLLPTLVALEVAVDVRDEHGARTVPVLDYVRGDERPLITHARVTTPPAARRVAVGRESRNANGTAIVSGAVSLTREGDAVTAPIVALCGVAPRVVRLTAVERVLEGQRPPAAEELEQQVAAALPGVADAQGGSGLPALLARVLVARLVERASAGKGGGR